REGIRLGICAPHLGRHHAECPRESLSSGAASAAGADGGGGNLLRLWSAGDLRMYRKQDGLPDASPRFGSTEVPLSDSSGTGRGAGRPAATTISWGSWSAGRGTHRPSTSSGFPGLHVDEQHRPDAAAYT